MNLLFLDINGVVDCKDDNFQLDRKKVRCLSNFCKLNNYNIVLSSDWRYGFKRKTKNGKHRISPKSKRAKYLCFFFLLNGLKIYDITPDIEYQCRGKEIVQYIEEIKKTNTVDKVLVIDDKCFDFNNYAFLNGKILYANVYGNGIFDVI